MISNLNCSKNMGIMALCFFFESGKILKNSICRVSRYSTFSKNFDANERKRSIIILVGPFFPSHGILRENLQQKIQFQMRGPKTTKNMCKTYATNTPPGKKICFLKKGNRPRQRFFSRVCKFCEEDHKNYPPPKSNVDTKNDGF